MELTAEQFERIKPFSSGSTGTGYARQPDGFERGERVQRRALPERFGNRHTVYLRISRWAKNGVLDRVFEELQRSRVLRIRIEAVCLDSTSVKVHPDGTGARKKGDANRSASPGAGGTPSFTWSPRMSGRP